VSDLEINRLPIRFECEIEIEEAEAKRLAEYFAAEDRAIARRWHQLEEINRRQLEAVWLAAERAHAWAIQIQGEIDLAKGDDDPDELESSIGASLTVSSMDAMRALAAHGIHASVSEEARHAARWITTALNHGRVPHPGDVGRVLVESPGGSAWSKPFIEQGQHLDRLAESFKNPQLSVHINAQRMDLVRETVAMLDAYTAGKNPTLEQPGKIGSASRALGSRDARRGDAWIGQIVGSLPWNAQRKAS
jgi:hypothetical protein